MTAYVALLRAVNVGGTGKLPMADLTRMGVAAGFAGVKTYIASGNLVFTSDHDEAGVKRLLEDALAAYAGKPVDVMVRSAAEMAAIRDANPFPDAPGNRVMAILLDTPPPANPGSDARHLNGETIATGAREIYVRYTDTGMGQSKLVIPAAKAGTARNMNTIAKLAEMAAAL